MNVFFNYEWPWSVVGTQLRGRHVRCMQPPVIKPLSSKAVTRSFRSSQRTGSLPVIHFPTPDYSKTPAKVDCWRRKPKIAVEDNEVSCAVTSSVVQI
jgi:hypothetical protein